MPASVVAIRAALAGSDSGDSSLLLVLQPVSPLPTRGSIAGLILHISTFGAGYRQTQGQANVRTTSPSQSA